MTTCQVNFSKGVFKNRGQILERLSNMCYSKFRHKYSHFSGYPQFNLYGVQEKVVMAKQIKKKSSSKKTHRSVDQSSESIKIGNISGGTGFAIGRDAQAVVTQHTGEEVDQVSAMFTNLEKIVSKIENEADKKVAESAVETLEKEVRKGEQADENTVKKWLNFLAETAPDAWEVAIDFFINPLLGVGTVFKKIAERAKLERETKTSKP